VLASFRPLYYNCKRVILRSNQYLMSPGYFSGAIQLGVLIQTAHAFERKGGVPAGRRR
jgi:hypothetical protein